MTDSEFTFSIFLGIFMLLCVFQQFRLIRLRRKIERIAESVTSSAAPNPAPPLLQVVPEYEELKKRIQVLERIATDGNPVLDREIEALRRA